MERTYNKTFICRSMTHFQYRNVVSSFDFCVSQSYGYKFVSLTDAASRNLTKSTHRVICNVYQSPFTLFTPATAESPVMENLFSVRICTSPESSINCPWISNKDCSMWSFLKSVYRLITDINKSLTRIYDCSPFHIQMYRMSLHIKSDNLIS